MDAFVRRRGGQSSFTPPVEVPGRFADLVERHFRVGVKSGPEWMVFCSMHDNHNTPALQINVNTGQFVCFSSQCGWAGGAKRLLAHCGEAEENTDYDLQAVRARLKQLRKGAGREVQMDTVDDSVLLRYSFPISYWGAHGAECEPDCRNHRAFSESTVKAFQLGYDPLSDAGTIPIRSVDGELYGVIRRFLGELAPGETKYRYPKGFKKSWEMFGSWLVDSSPDDLVVLVEGAVDAMRVWEAGFCALAIYGSLLSATQARMLRGFGFGRVVTFFDRDEDGRKAHSSCLGFRRKRVGKDQDEVVYRRDLDLRKSFMVSRVRYRGRMGSDPGSCTSEQIQRAIAAAT